MTDEQLHAYAREVAATLQDPDKKQLRFNEIVQAAKDFYRTDVLGGVCELIHSCDREDPLYVHKQPMAETLQTQYGWMK